MSEEEEEEYYEPHFVNEEPSETFPYLSKTTGTWVENILLGNDMNIDITTASPVDILFVCVAKFYPQLKTAEIHKKTRKNIIISKLKMIKDVFVLFEINGLFIKWNTLARDDLKDPEFLDQINYVFENIHNFVLKKELRLTTNKQIEVLQEMQDIQLQNHFYRDKLQSILDYIKKNPQLPFSSEMIKFITTPPTDFLP